ncbi:hypothetical protein L917_00409 [Phytophthora nicotianae]|uniref:Uncharacterized protein n=1 Tax=Phytophthora nicotianae TaxID=4792 RepID=W2M3B9_PHYNI|nr:hypothetical protein L915_00432 [Phytophthora nicotianae]ETM03346.1 hypothetical protein L917_00409 [Phytophthora nicotianae]
MPADQALSQMRANSRARNPQHMIETKRISPTDERCGLVGDGGLKSEGCLRKKRVNYVHGAVLVAI